MMEGTRNISKLLKLRKIMIQDCVPSILIEAALFLPLLHSFFPLFFLETELKSDDMDQNSKVIKNTPSKM